MAKVKKAGLPNPDFKQTNFDNTSDSPVPVQHQQPH